MFKTILTTLIVVFALSLAGVVHAKKVTPISTETATGFLRVCMDHYDQEHRRSSGAWGCCSKELDYCVACPTWPNPGSCVITSYKEGGPRKLMNQLTTPTAGAAMPPLSKTPTLHNKLKQPKATSAPTKAVSPPKKPIVKPIKQYQQIKVPTKTIQKIEK